MIIIAIEYTTNKMLDYEKGWYVGSEECGIDVINNYTILDKNYHPVNKDDYIKWNVDDDRKIEITIKE